MRLPLGRMPLALPSAAMVALLLSACGPLPELICTYDTIETCERAASAALDAVGDRSGVTMVTIKPPDGTWRREGARYLALAMVHRADGGVTLFRVSQTDDQPIRAEILATE